MMVLLVSSYKYVFILVLFNEIVYKCPLIATTISYVLSSRNDPAHVTPVATYILLWYMRVNESLVYTHYTDTNKLSDFK